MLGVIAGSLMVDVPEVLIRNRHGMEGLFPHLINYPELITDMRNAGVRKILAVHTVGGIHPKLVAGSICVPHDFIDYTYGRMSEVHMGKRHADVTNVLNKDVATEISRHLTEMKVSFMPGGVYGVTQGPRLESAAEVCRMERDGCHVVGMTAMPEAYVAQQLGLTYGSVCLVVNRAAGKNATAEELTPGYMERVRRSHVKTVEELIRRMLAAMSH